MKKKVVAGLVACLCSAQGFAQSSSNANAQQTSMSGASASTSGSGNSSLNNVGNSGGQSNSSANTSSVSGATAGVVGNSQNNGSASSSRSSASGGQGGAGGAGGGGGQGGSAGINANISPSTSITFTSPPTSTSNVNTRTTGETTQNLNQTYHGTTESIQSGHTETYIDYGGTQTIKNVPNVNAPPLTSSNDTCMGSASGGFSIPGLGLSAGSTYTDEHCKRIKMSRELWNKGMKAASLAMDCMDPSAREALELTGFTCPQTTRAQQRAAASAAPTQKASSPRGAEPADPSREQPGFAESAPVTTQVAEAASIRSVPAGQPDESVTVRRVDLPLDRRQP